VLRFHRAVYVVDGVRKQTTWWQLGDRILRHRTRAV